VTLFELTTEDRAPKSPVPGWTCIKAGRFGGKSAAWQNRQGWQVCHCGHPTANHPYYGIDPAMPGLFLTGGQHKGVGFGTLAEAMTAIDNEIARRANAVRCSATQQETHP